MFKKITAMLLVLGLITGVCTTVADEKIDLAAQPMKIFIDGAELTWDAPQYDPEEYHDSQYNAPFAPVMRALGYEVGYDEQTEIISAKKDNILIEIKETVNETEWGTYSDFFATKSVDGVIKYERYFYPGVIDGITYVSDYVLSDLTGCYAQTSYGDIRTLHIYDTEPYAQRMLETVTQMLDMYKQVGYDTYNTSEVISGTVDMEYNQPLFGTTVTGSMDISGGVVLSDGEFAMDLVFKTEGFANLLDVALHIAKQYTNDAVYSWGANDPDEFDPDPDIDIKMIFSGGSFLIKSNSLFDLFVPKGTPERNKYNGKWIRVNDISNTPAEVLEAMDMSAVEDINTYKTLVKTYTSLFNGKNFPQAAEAVVNAWEQLTSKSISIEEDDGRYTITQEITTDMIKGIVRSFATIKGEKSSWQTDEEWEKDQKKLQKTINDLLDAMSFDSTSVSIIEDGMLVSSISNTEFALTKIPGFLGISMGSYKMTMHSESCSADLSAELSFDVPESEIEELSEIISTPEPEYELEEATE